MSSNALHQLREEQRQRFASAKAEGRIQVSEPCPSCHQPPYSSEVCPVSGLFHNREHKTLIGGSLIDSKVISSSQLMTAIDRTRVKWFPSRTQIVSVDATSANIFQSFVAQLNWHVQRYGILYGLYKAEEKMIEVHAIYEPEQHGNAVSFEVIDDPLLPRVDQIAAALGLRRVGVVCTHPPRDGDTIVLSYRELLLCAKEQSRFGDECVLLTIAPSPTEGDDGATRMVVQCQAWQTSPQCIYYYRLGVLQEQPDEKALHVMEQARNVHCTIPLEVAQTDTDPSGHQRFTTKAPSTEIDTRWFTSYIAVQHFESSIVRGLFMRLSRPGMPPPTLINLRNYMQDPKRSSHTFVEKISDFHVIVFLLTKVLKGENDIEAVCRLVREQKMTETAKKYEAELSQLMARAK